jgi:hypothetical protein
MARLALAHMYVWDLIGDPDAAARVRDLGIGAVALAAAYHSVRAATPLHPQHRVVDALHAALYSPVRRETWRNRPLQPVPPSWLPMKDSFGAAAQELRNVGLPVYAWVSLTHSSRLGQMASHLTVRNAMGDRYAYALCPAHAEVVNYCVTLVREIVQLAQPQGLALEAAGPMGFVHGSHHEKTDGADYGTAQKQLLSLCFCVACEARYACAGIDFDQLRAAVCAGIDEGAASIEAALGDVLAGRVAKVRAAIARALRRHVIDAARALSPGLDIVLHASADRWSSGAFATVADGVDADADALVANCWPESATALANIAGLNALREKRRLAAYVLALPPKACDADALRAELDAYAAAGADEFHFYHVGLASRARLDAIGAALQRGGA